MNSFVRQATLTINDKVTEILDWKIEKKHNQWDFGGKANITVELCDAFVLRDLIFSSNDLSYKITTNNDSNEYTHYSGDILSINNYTINPSIKKSGVILNFTAWDISQKHEEPQHYNIYGKLISIQKEQ